MDVTKTITIPKCYGWQKEILKQAETKNIYCIASRQIGKTFTMQRLCIDTLLKGRRCVWYAPTFKQVIENYREIARYLGDVIKWKSTNQEIQTYGIEGDGRIFFRSADNPDSLRGLNNISLAVSDEFCFSDPRAYDIISPILAVKRGRFCAISSPNGTTHFSYKFWEECKKNPKTWYCCQHPWKASPHISAEWIAEQQAIMDPSRFRQEFLASFESKQGALFDPAWLRDIFVQHHEMPKPEHTDRSMVGVDPSLGKLESDWQSVCYVGVHNLICYVDCWAGRVSIPELCLKVKEMQEHYKAEGSAWERNGFQSLAADAFCNLFTIQPWVVLLNNQVEKDVRISRLATLLSRRQLRILDNAGGRLLHAQLSDWPCAGKATATGGGDDCPDALENAWRTLTMNIAK